MSNIHIPKYVVVSNNNQFFIMLSGIMGVYTCYDINKAEKFDLLKDKPDIILGPVLYKEVITYEKYKSLFCSISKNIKDSEITPNDENEVSTCVYDLSWFVDPLAQIVITDIYLDLYSTNKYSVSKFSQILNKLNNDNLECISIYKTIIDFCKKENCTLLEYYISNELRPNFSVKSIIESIERKIFQLSVTIYKNLHIH